MPRVRRTTADGNCVESMLTYSAKLKEGQFRVGRRAVGGLPPGKRTFADLKQPNLLGVSLFQLGGVQTRLENPRRFLMKLPWDPFPSRNKAVFRWAKWHFSMICFTNHANRIGPNFDRFATERNYYKIFQSYGRRIEIIDYLCN